MPNEFCSVKWQPQGNVYQVAGNIGLDLGAGVTLREMVLSYRYRQVILSMTNERM